MHTQLLRMLQGISLARFPMLQHPFPGYLGTYFTIVNYITSNVFYLSLLSPLAGIIYYKMKEDIQHILSNLLPKQSYPMPMPDAGAKQLIIFKDDQVRINACLQGPFHHSIQNTFAKLHMP